MNKELHAIQFDGSTFGMDIEADSPAYKIFKKMIRDETAINVFGTPVEHVLTVPYLYVAALMGTAHWLVSERGYFDKIKIDELHGEEWIYVKYAKGPIDFQHRRQPNPKELPGYWEGDKV